MNSRLLIITDNLDSENSLKRRLTDEGYQVQITPFSERRPLLLTHKFDLVVLELTLPDLGGIRVCRTIHQLEFRGPILILSVHNAVADRVAGLDAGADDYLGKPFDFYELLARLRALLRRCGPEGSVILFSDLELDKGLHEARRQGMPIHLNRMEFDLLALFMTHPQQILGRNTIMDQVWGTRFEGHANSLDVYLSRLRRKLGKPPLIHTIRSIGYILSEAAP